MLAGSNEHHIQLSSRAVGRLLGQLWPRPTDTIGVLRWVRWVDAGERQQVQHVRSSGRRSSQFEPSVCHGDVRELLVPGERAGPFLLLAVSRTGYRPAGGCGLQVHAPQGWVGFGFGMRCTPGMMPATYASCRVHRFAMYAGRSLGELLGDMRLRDAGEVGVVLRHIGCCG